MAQRASKKVENKFRGLFLADSRKQFFWRQFHSTSQGFAYIQGRNVFSCENTADMHMIHPAAGGQVTLRDAPFIESGAKIPSERIRERSCNHDLTPWKPIAIMLTRDSSKTAEGDNRR
jgi:hypothetical protein